MKAVILDAYAVNNGDLSWSSLTEQVDTLTAYDFTKPEEVIKRAKDAEILFTNKTVLSPAILEQLPKLQYVGVLATGYNVVDLVYLRSKGIAVTNVPAYGVDSVVQHCMANIFYFTNSLHENSKGVASDWPNSRDFCYWNRPILSLSDKTIGIVGFGNIGRALSQVCLALGMQVVVATEYPTDTPLIEFVSLETLFAQSDFISINRQLAEGNEGMVDKKLLSKMKKTAYLINTARGALINEKDLAEALNGHVIAGAALDVLSQEPPSKNNPLLQAKNCLVTPHIAWASKKARQNLIHIASNNLKSFLKGEEANRLD